MHHLWRTKSKIFYVYTHARPDGSIFYVGKGVGNRAKDFCRRNSYHQRIVAKYGRENIIIKAYATFDERHAYAAERQLIMALRKAGAQLANIDDGGNGRIGVTFTEEHREKLRLAGMGHAVSEETRRRISEAGRGRTATAETRAKLARVSRTIQVQAMASANRGKPKSEEVKARISAANTGKVRTPEMIQRLSVAHKGFKQDPEVVARRALAIRATFAARRAAEEQA
jgi:hypothetical protein